MMNTKFLGLQTDNHINWKNHTNMAHAVMHNFSVYGTQSCTTNLLDLPV